MCDSPPRSAQPAALVRRSYSYDRGNGDRGLIFSWFQRDLAKGFEAVQKRLEGKAMAKYILTTGGGYFFVPPPGTPGSTRCSEAEPQPFTSRVSGVRIPRCSGYGPSAAQPPPAQRPGVQATGNA